MRAKVAVGEEYPALYVGVADGVDFNSFEPDGEEEPEGIFDLPDELVGALRASQLALFEAERAIIDWIEDNVGDGEGAKWLLSLARGKWART